MLPSSKGKLRVPPIWVRGLVFLLQLLALYGAWLAFERIFEIAPARARYPGELEWMEGGVLHHIRRTMAGEPLYVKPSLEFTPYIYAPFYYWVSAVWASFTGLSVTAMRAIQWLYFSGSCALIVFWCHTRTESWVSGLIGAGVFAATFRLGGAWFDIVRSDSLLVLLVLASGYLIVERKGLRSGFFGGLLLTCAVWTKQSAVVVLAGVCLWAVLQRTKRQVLIAAVAATTTLLGLGTLHLSSGGWSTYYLFTMPSAHPLLEKWRTLFFTSDLLGPLAIVALVAVFEFGSTWSNDWPGQKAERVRTLGFSAFVLGVLGFVYSSRIHLGMFDNVLMPMHALFGLLCGLALGRMKERERSGRGAQEMLALRAAVLLGIYGTITNLEYPTEQQTPTDDHFKRADALVTRLEKLPKGTWVPYHSGLAADAGLPPRAHWMALIDVIRGEGKPAKDLILESHEALRSKKFPAIVWSVNDPSADWFYLEMRKHYRSAGRISGPNPLTGWEQRPTSIWVPR